MKWIIIGICIVRSGLFASETSDPTAQDTPAPIASEFPEEEELIVFEEEEFDEDDFSD